MFTHFTTILNGLKRRLVPKGRRQEGGRHIGHQGPMDRRERVVAHAEALQTSRRAPQMLYTRYYTRYYNILYYTILYSTLLYSTLLYSTLLYSTLLYSTLLYYTMYALLCPKPSKRPPKFVAKRLPRPVEEPGFFPAQLPRCSGSGKPAQEATAFTRSSSSVTSELCSSLADSAPSKK